MRMADILGDFEFEWVGALQFQGEAQRAQQLLMFANLMGQLEPQLARQGKAVNWAELVPMIWRHGLGERGLDRVIVDMPQQPMQAPPQGPMPGMPAEGGAPGPSPGSNGTAMGTQGTNGARPPAGVPGLQTPNPAIR
jgi:hypothetical protein